MPSDIVQVIDRVLSAAANEIGGPSKDFSEDAARLRSLRDRIEEDRKAYAALYSPQLPASRVANASFALLDAERALLAFCRKVGP